MSALSREIGWRIILVSQKTSKENPERTGWGNSGSRWTGMSQKNHPQHRSGNKRLSFFPHKELPSEEPLAVEAPSSCSVPYAVALRIGTSICWGEADSFVHSVHGPQEMPVCWRVPNCQSLVIPHDVSVNEPKSGTAVGSSGHSYLIE